MPITCRFFLGPNGGLVPKAELNLGILNVRYAPQLALHAYR